MEAHLLARLFPPATRASSTKGFTGHTLGAAGIIEAVIALLAIEGGLIPGNLGARVPDPACSASFAWHAEHQRVAVAMSNSFGFGGNNACLVFGQAQVSR
jgi:3-oxoacyl-[acyl-carrier-protein] synthase-1